MRKSQRYFQISMVAFYFSMISIILQLIIGDIFLLLFMCFFFVQLMSAWSYKTESKKELRELDKDLQAIKRVKAIIKKEAREHKK